MPSCQKIKNACQVDNGKWFKIDEFLNAAKKWKEEYEKLRNIVLDCELTEEFKWMHPCYTFEKKT